MATLHDKIFASKFTVGTDNPSLEFIPTGLAMKVASKEDALKKLMKSDFDDKYDFVFGVSEAGTPWIARTLKESTQYEDFFDDIEDL